MNYQNESSTSEGHVSDYRAAPKKLLPQEIKMLEECSRGLLYKFGIPFAVTCEVLAYYFKKPGVEESTQMLLFKRGFRFILNTFIGKICATPICYYKFLAFHEALKNSQALEDQGFTKLQSIEPDIQVKDFSNPMDQFSDLSETEGSLSLSDDTPKLLPEETEEIKTPKTTYQELRARHRNKDSISTRNKEFPKTLEKEPPKLGTPPTESPLFNDSLPAFSRRKNKYGDDME